MPASLLKLILYALFATFALSAATMTSAQGDDSITAELREIERVVDRLDQLHVNASRLCDIPGMREDEEQLKKYAEAARKLAKRLKGAGQFATADPEYARWVADKAAQKHAAAVAREPENCPREAKDANAAHNGQPAAGGETPLQKFIRLRRTADQLDQVHLAAAKSCNIPLMAATLAQLQAIEAELKRMAQAGIAGLDHTALDRVRFQVWRIWLVARDRKPENCPKSEPPPPQPPAKPTGGTKDCPSPGKSAPEHGMRFTPPDDQSKRMLAAHNRARVEVGAVPLIWDRELAEGAAGHAAQMSLVGRVHAPREGRKCVRENLLQSLRGGRSVEQMVGVWVGERVHFKPGIFPDVSTTGDWARVGHYTQVIWPTTTHIGCAVRADARYDWTVCRYSPPGNQDGKSVIVVPPPEKPPPGPPGPIPLPYPPPPPPTESPPPT